MEISPSQFRKYAVNTADLLGDMTFSVSQRIAAGAQPLRLEQGSIARIFTGAVIPEGANAVVMQEDCQLLDDGRVKILDTVKAQENIRPQGQDLVCDNVFCNKVNDLMPLPLVC